MADEVKRIIEVEAKFETLAQLQSIIDKNKKAIEDLDKHSKEYQEGLSHVKAAQAEYNREMRIAIKENTSAKGSYNDLANQLARLTESWKRAEPGTAAFEKYTREVNRVKAQLEQMDHSIGNYQRNVGNYTNSISSALGRISPAAEKAFRSVTKSAAQMGTAVKATIAGIGAALVVVAGTFKTWKDSLRETQTTGDELNKEVQGWKNTWDSFQKSVATFDFSNFINSLREAAEAGRDLYRVLDSVFERTNSVNIQRAMMSAENAALEEAARNTKLSYAERLAAANKYIANVTPLYEQEIETAKRVRDAQLENLFALTNRRKYATKEEREAAKEQFAANIKNYNLNEDLIRQAQEYLSIEKKREAAVRSMGKQGGYIYANLVEEYDAVLNSASDSVKQFAVFAKQYNLSNDEQVKAYVDAEVAYNNAQAALYNQNKRFITLKNNLEAQQTKVVKANFDERKKIAEETATALLKVDERAINGVDRVTRKRNEMAKLDAELLQEVADIDAQLTAEIDGMSEALGDSILEDIERQKQAVQEFRDTISLVADSIASIMDDVAGAYQNEIKAQVQAGEISAEQGEREFERVKALQYGVTWINTLSAVMGALADPATPSWIMRAANAATALSTGIANTIKITNTTLGNTATSSAVGQGVQTAAPAMQVSVPEYRTITSASDEAAINQRATSQKVVLVTSELEAHNEGRRVKLAEATF